MKPPHTVEHRACRRHGLCLAVAPDAFRVGADGRVKPVAPADGPAIERARQAARLCPMQAIRVEG